MYGATKEEKKNGMYLGGLIGLFTGSFILGWVPSKLSGLVGAKVSLFNLPTAIISIAVGAIAVAALISRSKAQKIRTFRQRRVS